MNRAAEQLPGFVVDAAFSSSAWPMPCATPPCTWPSTIIGLITRPTSSTATKFTTCVTPVSRIDLDLADVAAAREGEVLRVVERGFLQARLQLLDRVVVRDVGGERDLGQRLRLVGAGDGEFAVLELDVVDRGFHQVGGDFLALGDDLVHRLHHRAAADREAAAAVGAHAERDFRGVAVHDLDLVDRHAELLVRRAGRTSFRGPGRGCASR